MVRSPVFCGKISMEAGVNCVRVQCIDVVYLYPRERELILFASIQFACPSLPPELMRPRKYHELIRAYVQYEQYSLHVQYAQYVQYVQHVQDVQLHVVLGIWYLVPSNLYLVPNIPNILHVNSNINCL